MKPKISADINGRVNSANLALSDKRIEEELEVRMAHLSEIAFDTALSFCGEGFDAEKEMPDRTPFERSVGGDTTSVVEYFFASASPARDHTKASIACHLDSLEAYDGIVSEYDKAYYVKRLVGYIEEISGLKLEPDTFFCSVESKCKKVRFVGYGDMENACRMLAPDRYEFVREDTLEEACIGIVEEGGFAVIPWRTSRDGVLRLFLSLVGRYDLRVHSSCRIDKADSLDFSDYVLVSSRKESIAFDTSFDRPCILLKLKGSAAEHLHLARLTLALDLLGAKTESVDAVSYDGREKLALVRLKKESVCATLAYMFLFGGGRDAIVGLFDGI